MHHIDWVYLDSFESDEGIACQPVLLRLPKLHLHTGKSIISMPSVVPASRASRSLSRAAVHFRSKLRHRDRATLYSNSCRRRLRVPNGPTVTSVHLDEAEAGCVRSRPVSP